MSLSDIAQDPLHPMMRRFEIRMAMGVWVLVLVTVLVIYILTRGLG